MRRNMFSKTVIILIFLLVTGTVLYTSNPLTKSEKQIRQNLLKSTPVGSEINNVLTFIKSKKTWEVREVSYEHGFLDTSSYLRRTVGKKSIIVDLGEYYSPLLTSVEAFWGFDENNKMVDIVVIKYVDAP